MTFPIVVRKYDVVLVVNVRQHCRDVFFETSHVIKDFYNKGLHSDTIKAVANATAINLTNVP